MNLAEFFLHDQRDREVIARRRRQASRLGVRAATGSRHEHAEATATRMFASFS
jgi:hypothetical protein